MLGGLSKWHLDYMNLKCSSKTNTNGILACKHGLFWGSLKF